jgi:hypothetical protein
MLFKVLLHSRKKFPQKVYKKLGSGSGGFEKSDLDPDKYRPDMVKLS